MVSGTTICSKHNDIYGSAQKIINEVNGATIDNVALKVSLLLLGNDILELAKQAKEDGQKMEDRLKEYKDQTGGARRLEELEDAEKKLESIQAIAKRYKNLSKDEDDLEDLYSFYKDVNWEL